MNEAHDTDGGRPIAAPRPGETTQAGLAHLGTWIGLIVPLANLGVPALLWILAARRAPTRSTSEGVGFVVHHARESLRFQLFATGAALLLMSALEARLDGFAEAFLFLALIAWAGTFFGLTIRAARSAWRGDVRTYPLPGTSPPRLAAEA